MSRLVTIDQAKTRLLREHEAEADIIGAIEEASAMVLAYLNLGDDAYQNSDGGMDVDTDTLGYFEVPKQVQSATLYLVGILLRDRDGAEGEKWTPGYLPAPVVSMLYPLRDPTLA